jgi:hypothetical protein
VKVDDDDDDEGDDDDDLEALAAQGQSRPGERLAADSADPGNKTASKSVRLAAGDDGEQIWLAGPMQLWKILRCEVFPCHLDDWCG